MGYPNIELVKRAAHMITRQEQQLHLLHLVYHEFHGWVTSQSVLKHSIAVLMRHPEPLWLWLFCRLRHDFVCLGPARTARGVKQGCQAVSRDQANNTAPKLAMRSLRCAVTARKFVVYRKRWAM